MDSSLVQGHLSIGPSDAPVTAILFHGRDRTPEEMRALASALRLPLVRFIFPEAPGGTWYPKRFMRPLAENHPALDRALSVYADLVDMVIAGGTPAERLVLGGFSQGACLTAEFLIRQPRRYGAAILWTGGVIGPPGTVWPVRQALAGMPVYLSSSETDDWVPVERFEETADLLRRCGTDLVTDLFTDRDHRVSDAEIVAARSLLVTHGLDGTVLECANSAVGG